VQDY